MRPLSRHDPAFFLGAGPFSRARIFAPQAKPINPAGPRPISHPGGPIRSSKP